MYAVQGGMLHAMQNYKGTDTQSSRLLDGDQMEKVQSKTSAMFTSIDSDELKEDNGGGDDGGDEQQNVQDDRDEDAPMPMIKKWVLFFCGCGALLILEGISYAVAYSQNTGDFEFPEVHPFFIFTIFVFFAVLHSVFCKYSWIK